MPAGGGLRLPRWEKCGLGGPSTAVAGEPSAPRTPLWQDAVRGTHRIAVSYNPGLRRYLLTTITIDRSGWMSLYDAPEPGGPRTHVHTEHVPERWGTLTIIFTFVNKWLSPDGRDFVLVPTKNDRWATIAGRFHLAGDIPPQ